MKRPDHGYTLIEVLVSLLILLVGILTIVYYFPRTLEARRQAKYLSESALLAQRKAQEVRRDDDVGGSVVAAIAALDSPTEPLPFPEQPNLSYSFCGRTQLYPETMSPQGDPGVARVIVRYSASYRRDQDVVYEMRFGH